MDFRIGKRVRAGRASTKLNLDFYNLFNISTTQAYNESFGPAWLNANTIMTGPLIERAVQFGFTGVSGPGARGRRPLSTGFFL